MLVKTLHIVIYPANIHKSAFAPITSRQKYRRKSTISAKNRVLRNGYSLSGASR